MPKVTSVRVYPRIVKNHSYRIHCEDAPDHMTQHKMEILVSQLRHHVRRFFDLTFLIYQNDPPPEKAQTPQSSVTQNKGININ